jgi:hypothetical protein
MPKKANFWTMKPITDTRHDCDDDHMTVEQIVAGIRWIDETLTVLHREMAAAMNPDDPRQSANFRNH